MRALAGAGSSRAAFIEEKRIAALSAPLESRGRLVFSAPAHLEKHTDQPVRESITVDGDRLTYALPDEQVRRTLSLDRAPELRGLVEAVRGTLAGDLAGLRRYYSVGLEGTDDAWKLTLVPLDERVRALVAVVEIDGAAGSVRRVATKEAGGDSTLMTITPGG